MISSSDAKRDIFNLYNKKPRGWHVFIKKDQRGYYDTIVVHGKDVWFIKEEQVKPYELIGFGIKEEIEDKEAFKSIRPYQFGFRPVSGELVDNIMETFSKGKNLDSVINKIMSEKPLPIDRIKSELMVQGPVYYTKPINLTSNQSELDMKLRIELEKLLYKKYPHLLTTYL
ncbi:MAG: hypothetical protein H3Z51_09260 [archaeon]|nr:hypothetical protein [archaeon]